MQHAQEMADATAQALSLRQRTRCSSRRPASSASSCDGERRARHRDAAATLSRRRRPVGRARHHDDRSVPEGSGGRSARRCGHVPRRRHRQGLRHDRAADGDDARVRDDGRGGRAGAAAARAEGGRATTRSTPSPWTASARPTTACSRWRTARRGVTLGEADYPRPRRRAAPGLRTARHRHRPRRRRRDQADHRPRRRRARRTRTQGGRRGRSPTRRW